MATGTQLLGSQVKIIQSDSAFQEELVKAGDKLVVVEFTRKGCKPSADVEVKFFRLAPKHANVVFQKVDIQVCHNIAKLYKIEATPTFCFFKNREKLDQEVRGADISAVESGILQLMSSSSSGDSGSSPVPRQTCLNNLIDKSKSECLNEADDHTYDHALSRDKGHLESDCDEQLIILLSFSQPVKLHTLQITGPNGQAPRKVRLFINQVNTLTFDDAERCPAVQEFELTSEDTGPESTIPLQFVKYQNVQNLTIFIADNQAGDEVTIVDYIGIYGNPLATTNMKDFKRVAGEVGERH